ncbi:MAG TPA: type IV secretion system DNA-binding domain-containing protein [Candidatus Paceibacterota bacterium]|nr:type IV secretion system DNA-binding domain-containing protein [Candidatus Paceibacterota bacterium]
MDNEIPKNKDITYFAKTDFRNTNTMFGIKRKDRRQHMYVLGKSGTGKSVLLSNLIIQNIQNGEGVCVVDPHGELVEELLDFIPEERVKDVIYFNPADRDYHIGFNVMEMNDPKYKHLVASGLMGIFTKIWANAWSSRMEYILNNAILALLDTPDSTLLGIPRLLVDKDYRQMIINNLKDPVVKSFWTHEYEQWRDQFRNEAIAPIQNKVGQFLSSSIIRNVVGQPKSTIDIFKIMNEGKIFLVNVSKGRIGEDNSALLGGMIITKIQLAAMERVRIPEDRRKDFYLYVDEFQNFATDSFANILSEARKYRLNLVIAHQYIAQLVDMENSKVKDSVFGNVGTMISFRVGADDADFLEKEFGPEFTAQDLVNLPNYHIYLKLMIDGVTSRPFSAVTLPPIKADKTLGVKDKIVESSRELYTRKREDIENEINKWSDTLQTGDGEEKFKAECSVCQKSFFVPFEPQKGRPLYCRECLAKIKEGKLEVPKNYSNSRQPKKSKENNLNKTGSNEIDSKKEIKNNDKNKPREIQLDKKEDEQKTDHNKQDGLSLRDLLKKVERGEIKEVEQVSEKTPAKETISLSSLKNKKDIKEKKEIPTKEATEEKKDSLRDAFARIMFTSSKSKDEETEKEDEKIELNQGENRRGERVDFRENITDKNGLFKKSQPELEVKTSTKRTEEESNKVSGRETSPIDTKEKINKDKEKQDDSWQKPKVKKEVPEDVLRRVLE